MPGIVAVALGGSVARGEADDASDVDLGLYYDRARPPDLPVLRALAAELDDDGEAEAVTELGAWGPWIDGGAWLTVRGRRVDWLYRDLVRVADAIDAVERGVVSAHYQPGHPHAFHGQTYWAELRLGVILSDPSGRLAELRERVPGYPSRLRSALVARWLWEARFSVDTARKPAARGDVAYVAGAAFRAVAALVQVLYALEERPFVNEKGSVRAVMAFAVRPDAFAERAEATLAVLGRAPAPLVDTLETVDRLVEETERLARDAG